MKNLFADTPKDLKVELIETILQTPSIHVERIVSQGHHSPDGFWYDQNENELVILLQGSAGLRFEDKEDAFVLSPGDYLNINRHQRHRVEWTDPEHETVWLAVYYK